MADSDDVTMLISDPRAQIGGDLLTRNLHPLLDGDLGEPLRAAGQHSSTGVTGHRREHNEVSGLQAS